jgi:hypothetical protein
MAVEMANARRSARRLRAMHLVVGGSALAAFLVSGAYMRAHNPPIAALEPGLHRMFTSRHIYILAAALLNLVLGVYARPAVRRWAWAIQRGGSLLLVVAAALLVAAFVAEPMAGANRTPVSSFGLFSLFAGSLLHVGAALRGLEAS